MMPEHATDSTGGRHSQPWQRDPSPYSADFMDRRRLSEDALGGIRRVRVCGVPIYRSPDWWVYPITTCITALIVFSNMFVTWDQLGVVELTVCWTLLAVAHFSSLRLLTSDPGIYPRLSPEEVDPLGQNMDLVFCRVCRMRRPPRTSHCYQCNVCVLEHDHHCGILGGCVGARTLRWFTLYLCTVSLATLCGLYWQARYLLIFLFREAVGGASRGGGAADGRIHDEAGPGPLISSGPLPPHAPVGDPFLYPILSLGVGLVDLCVGSVLGFAGGYYVILTLTDTTRRESQRQETSMSVLKHPRLVVHNLWKAAFPPPSLVEADGYVSRREEDASPLV